MKNTKKLFEVCIPCFIDNNNFLNREYKTMHITEHKLQQIIKSKYPNAVFKQRKDIATWDYAVFVFVDNQIIGHYTIH